MPREQRPEPRLRLDDAIGQRAIALARLARQPRQAHAPRELALGAAVAVGLDEPLVALALGEHGVDALRGVDELLLVARRSRRSPRPSPPASAPAPGARAPARNRRPPFAWSA